MGWGSAFNVQDVRYPNPITQAFADDRLVFPDKTAGFRRIDLHWYLTLEPSKLKAFERKPQEKVADTSRMLADIQKIAAILESHLDSTLGLWLLDKNGVFQFFSYLFNLEEWAGDDQLRADTRRGPADRQESSCMATISRSANDMLRCSL